MRGIQNNLSWRNLKRYPGRSLALIVLASLMSLILFGGSLCAAGLRRGLSTLEDRLGADIMVVSYQTTTRFDLDSLALQGVPTPYYMKMESLEKIKGFEGIEKITSQYFLTETSSNLCEGTMKIIGYDPETDFLVKSWIAEGRQASSKTGVDAAGSSAGEVVAGSGLQVTLGQTLTIYGVPCKVTGRLAQTDSFYDTALFVDFDTIRQIICAATEQELADFSGKDPEKQVSAILIDVSEEDRTIEEVAGEINLHVRGVVALQTKNMMSSLSAGAAGAADLMSLLAFALWIPVLLILGAVFTLIQNERKKEFAILRVIGTSRAGISRIITGEAFLVSVAGGLFGLVLGLPAAAAAAGRIRGYLEMPFVLPETGTILLLAGDALMMTVGGGCVASLFCASRMSRIDPGTVLRGEK